MDELPAAGDPGRDDARRHEGARDWSAPGVGGIRRNALTARGWVALAEVDRRVADALLGTLEDAGIAAYAEPVGGTPGAPAQDASTDRVWVDEGRRDVAEAVVAAELPGLLEELEPERDVEGAFAAIVAGWDHAPDLPVPPWPVDEDLAEGTRAPEPARRPARPVDEDEDEDDDEGTDAGDDEGHYEPPPPGPLPEPHPVTRWASLAVAAGLLLLVGLPLLGTRPSITVQALAVVAIVAGVGTLVLRMRDGPSADDGPDDGAVI